MDLDQWIQIQQDLLKAQLRVLRQYRSGRIPSTDERREPRVTSTSQIDMVADILRSAAEPLHITTIIEQAAARYGISLDRESLASSLSKKIRKGQTFVRVAPNTFGLRGPDS